MRASPPNVSALLLVLPFLFPGTVEGRSPNVLLVMADDLRYFSDEVPRLRTPNYDALAARGISFQNAFAQQAVCAPSRNSLLTGRRPDTLHLYDFYSYWRTFSGNYSTLPEFFKDNGYKSFSFGKVFHPGISSNFSDDFPYSWSEPPYHPSTETYKQSKVCVDEETGKLSKNLVCPVVVEFQPEGTLPDIQTTETVIEKLNSLKNNEDQPFFIAVGFHKPHIPLKYPIEYLDYYPLNRLKLPKMPFHPPTLPTVAWNPWTDIRDREDIHKLNLSFPFGHMPDTWSLKIKQSYFASISYVDNLLGKILKHIDFTNTIIVLTSDHGWSLGEHGEWSKYSNYDISLKVPLVIVAPQFKKKQVKDVVELVDLFPTLAELSGLIKHFPKCDKSFFMKLCSEGKSLVPVMKNEMKPNKNEAMEGFAFSQYPRPGTYPTKKPNSDKPKLKDIKIMGYSVRTSRFRYTEWVEFNHTTFKPNWENIYGKEFYDHSFDAGENLNLENRKELKDIQEYLSAKLKEYH